MSKHVFEALSLNHKEFEMVSKEGLDLIKKLLTVNPAIRLTAKDALNDPWFAKFKDVKKGSDTDLLNPTIIQSLRDYRGTSALKKAAMNVLVKMCTSKEIASLGESFKAIDVEGNGMISVEELTEAIKKSGTNMTEAEIKSILLEVDSKHNK